MSYLLLLAFPVAELVVLAVCCIRAPMEGEF